MKRGLLWAMVLGAGYAYLAFRPARVRVARKLDADPTDLLRLVAKVEREPELIPFVTAVEVDEQAGDAECAIAIYRVTTRMYGIPGWARFAKRICAEEGRADWRSLGGTGGLLQEGTLQSHYEGSVAATSIDVTTRFSIPVVGPVLAHFSSPFLRFAFNRWLQNLESEAQQTAILRPDAQRREEAAAGNVAAYR